ncbi:MAG TPA: prepilin-type cleavage/methylation domain-containing protein [Xanthomonadaceae bacterium]|jgi:prepilin-type N-terminal cleavage/methylation domain-containing protein|nr:prepilin-type cleavage/methylation domain-containing protein [Xanthomonadaceae bacterium]
MPTNASSVPSSRGFTILEMSVVLVVIALIVGAAAVGRDLYRSAQEERFSSDFVQAWLLAYDRFVAGTGTVPGDDFDNPTGLVAGGTNRFVCDLDLQNAMLAAGVTLPDGRGEGFANRYVYQDARGNPQDVRVCVGAVDWAEPAGSVGAFALRPRNVMRFEGLTPSLAATLDTRLDGRVDPFRGRFREVGRQNALATPTPARPWSADDRDNLGGGTNPDDQVALVQGYLRMSQ